MLQLQRILGYVLLLAVVQAEASKQEYKMCVPHGIFNACMELVSQKASENVKIICVPARDRMECLEKVEKREADFMAVDPEDMYVAFQIKNEDFSVFSEIRTIEEPNAEFRYEGIMLIHKNASIKSLDDLRGKKSCHTGYGRNVGYKIPITKLRKHGVIEISTDQYLPSLERELKGLSELFTESCVVGKFSPNDEIDRLYKRRYSNLCALCEDPVKCDYPDKYSGYEGAIRCLVERGGDVAFTKVIYVRKFFGLPINGKPSKTQPQANPNDYEYLCEDGSRRAVTEKACTWAQRPWQGYMGNSDVETRLGRLQNRIEEFYEDGKKSNNKEAAKKLWINEKNLVVKKDKDVSPGDHLIRAQYIDVIERGIPIESNIRLCVKSDIEMRKCEVMRKAAYSRDIRPAFMCIQADDCIQSVRQHVIKKRPNDENVTLAHRMYTSYTLILAVYTLCINVRNNESDAAIVSIENQQQARESQLIPVAHEIFDDHYYIVVKKDLSEEQLYKAPIQYDAADAKSRNAALNFNYKRGNGKCSGITTNESPVRVILSSSTSKEMNLNSNELVCNGLRKAFAIDQLNNQLTGCAYDATPPTAVYVRNSMIETECDAIKHAFSALSNKFGANGSLVDVFELFGEFETGKRNILFSDDAKSLITDDSDNQTESFFNYEDHETMFKNIQCHN